ncbi:MAG: hypothetical protein F4047_18280 [Caldilineaceae bacterium SB0670_bin_27]|uniref:Uncharacterized protein n=1 Tax=Caldilineaceae bacterium SB0664_bin_27 TaxID=2605260 RepID=A0A6B0YUD0_9CHLR|nr:hypothetical protein [Caldilineaceae bacterium SB0664_bin_27]MYJ80035.1 hypothetical protein [Caldilineaceae bacterium SB0670_bin_27]
MGELLVPVYLNQKIVFDLLAMLQGGISTVTTVTQTTSETRAEQQKISAGFGVSEVLSTLLKVNLSGDLQNSNAHEADTFASEERIHTPASLFFQLRNLLFDKNYIVSVTDNLPAAREFIEFEGSLRRNPIVETFDSLVALGEIVLDFEEKPQLGKARNRNLRSDNQRTFQQIAGFSKRLKEGGTIDLIAEDVVIEGCSAVITLEAGFLNDPSMSDLVDGQFKVIGKVIRSIDHESESINLLRKTALSTISTPVLADMLGKLDLMGGGTGLNIPKPEWEVRGPAIHVLPIAIYA